MHMIACLTCGKKPGGLGNQTVNWYINLIDLTAPVPVMVWGW